jgi:2-C-methyl-D-erythritol 4-phosphate cytidylyltransferase/2-C-methyl-D-erythritol 2,4-cyclodiphosphate synthase
LPKQYRKICGEPVIKRALLAFARHPEVFLVQPVINPADSDLYAAASKDVGVLPAVSGAEFRQGSVRAGVEALGSHAPEVVLVHDAARPFVSDALITRAIAAGRSTRAAVPVIAVTDTIKAVDPNGIITGTIDRIPLRLVQTPQAFAFSSLLDAHRRALTAGRESFTDDAGLAEWAGLKVSTFDGEASNVKLTTDEDFKRMEVWQLAALGETCTGFGFDVHQFGHGDHVMLGGVRIPHERGLSGHSDADIVLHAIVDAVLGALAEGDIGAHFPPGDPQWRGASSDRFLAFAVDRVRERGGRIAHLDVTIVCEVPRIGPHRDAIRARIAEIAGIPMKRIGIKATTSEKMGFTGRGEGMAAFATATVRLPWSD